MQKPIRPTRFAPRSPQIVSRSGDIFRRGVIEIETLHQVIRFVACRGAASAKQIGNEHRKTVRCEAIGGGFHAVVESPPLFQHHDAGRILGARRPG